MECLKTEVAINCSTNLHSDYRSDHFIIFTQPRLLKISNTWEKRFDHLLEMGGRRFRVILFRRRTGVSIPCKEMIGVKRFLPVLIYRQISRDCILNQQPHWIVYHFLAGSLSSKFQSLKIWFHLDTSKLENIISNLFCSPHAGCGCEEDESQMLMADSLWEMTSNIKEVMDTRQIEKKQNKCQRDTQYAQNSYSQLL